MPNYVAEFIHVDGSISGGRLIGTTFEAAVAEAKFLAAMRIDIKIGRVKSDDDIEAAEFPVLARIAEKSASNSGRTGARETTSD